MPWGIFWARPYVVEDLTPYHLLWLKFDPIPEDMLLWDMAFSITPDELDQLGNQPIAEPMVPVLPAAVPQRTLPTAMLTAPRWILHDKKKVPYNPRTQRPFTKKDGNYNNVPELWTNYSSIQRHKQVGFVLGGGFVGIDLDDVIVDGKLLPWAQKLVDHFNTYTEYSIGGTGIHMWFKGTVTGAPFKKLFDHIEFYWAGRYFAVSGNHVPGTPIELRDDDSEKLQEFYRLLTSGDIVAHMELMGKVREPESGGKVPVDCPWEADHSEHTGTLESAIFVDNTGTATGFKCLHGHCSAKRLPDLMKWTGLKYPRNGGQLQVSTAGWIMARPGVIDLTKPANYERALDNLKVQFRWNSFREQAEISTNGSKWEFYDDGQDGHLFYEVSQQLQTHAHRDVFETVKHELWQRFRYHPVKDYLATLTWDGVPRIDRWLIDYAGADDTPFIQAVSGITLIAGIKRIRQPGVKFDEMVVLESPQGMNKSSALRCLAVHDEWFSDDLPLGAESKVVIESTVGKWVIEAAELQGLNNRREAADIKSFMSRQFDGPARLAYGHEPISRPREFIVIGSTNSHEYLQDPTGNRRFWPVRIKEFNLDALSVVRDQLWAEAAFRESKGESIRLKKELWEAARVEQSKREAEHPWIEDLEQLVDGKDFIQSMAIWHRLNENSRDSGKSKILNDLMRKLGFIKKHIRFDGAQTRVWVRAGSLIDRGLLPYPEERRITSSDLVYDPGD